MKISNQSVDKITTRIGDEPVRITNCLYMGPVTNPEENDYFNMDIGNIFKDKDPLITEGEYIEFNNSIKTKCILNIVDSSYIKFKDFTGNLNERVFVVNNLYCSKKRKVILRFGKYCKLKVWINGLLVLNSCVMMTDSYFLIFELSKGDNIVFTEMQMPEIYLQIPFTYSLRINDYYNEFSGIDGELVKDYINQEVLDKITVLQEKWNFADSSFHEFMIIPRDFINIKKDDKILIKILGEENSVLDEMEVDFYQKVKCPISNRKNLLLTYKIIYKTLAGEEVCYENVILTGNIPDYVSQIEQMYKLAKLEYNLNDEDCTNIEGRIRIIMNSEPVIVKYEKKVILRIMDYIHNDRHFSDFITENGSNAVYYTSKLDNQVMKYNISIPENYSSADKYPLVIFLSKVEYDNFSQYFSKLENWQIIFVDITGRGVTAGSYIGEASFMEIFHNIINKYNIDMDRVYLVGYSNGAYAAWALAQVHPYLFSAIVAIAGAPCLDNIENLMNINIMSIYGDKDSLYEECNGILSNILDKYNKYKEIIIKEADHNSVYFNGLGKYIITWLLQYEKTRFPKKIYFRTERIRHNKTYWVEIYGMDKTAKYAEVKGEIVDDSTLCLELTGISQIIVTIPDFVHKAGLVVKINDRLFSFDHSFDENRLYFMKSGYSYILLKSIEDMELQQNSKGMGILDIYMDSLKIVTPAGNNPESDTIINSIAKNFAKPETQGWIAEIFVDYPVVCEDMLTRDDLEKHNLVILGCENNNHMIRNLQNKLPVRFDNFGFFYRDNFTEGDYCILFICSSPFNENKKVLIVYANSYTTLKECFFIRCVTIPSYSSGLHPYLNSESIIYDGIDYFVIDVLGNDIFKPV